MSIDENGALDDIRLFEVCELIHQIHFGNQTNFAAKNFCKSDTVALIWFKAIPITERASEAPFEACSNSTYSRLLIVSDQRGRSCGRILRTDGHFHFSLPVYRLECAGAH